MPLNLKLDNPSQYAREAPREAGSAETVPVLGGDARPLPQTPLSGARTSPYPSEPNANR